MNGMVMYDRNSETLWSHITGEAIDGPLKGRRLDAILVTFTGWEQWRALHPDTVALDKGGGYRSDSYASYYRGGSKGIVGGGEDDERLPAKSFVIGVYGDEEARAYPRTPWKARPS